MQNLSYWFFILVLCDCKGGSSLFWPSISAPPSDWGCVATRSSMSGLEIYSVSCCCCACCPFCVNQSCRTDGVYFSEASALTCVWLIWTTTINLLPPGFISLDEGFFTNSSMSVSAIDMLHASCSLLMHHRQTYVMNKHADLQRCACWFKTRWTVCACMKEKDCREGGNSLITAEKAFFCWCAWCPIMLPSCSLFLLFCPRLFQKKLFWHHHWPPRERGGRRVWQITDSH